MNKKIKFYSLWLALLIIAVFLLQFIPGFTDVLVLNNKVYSGEFWRFLTAIFLHGSPTHLLFNLVALVFFGFVLEKTIGSKNFLLVFLISGLVANIIGVNFYGSSLGASGAIYGIIGCLTLMRPMMMVWAFGLILPMFLASIVWVAGDLLRTFGLFDPGKIGSIAHLSGIGIGLIAGIFYRIRLKGSGLRSPQETRRRNDFEISDTYIEQWENTYVKPRRR